MLSVGLVDFFLPGESPVDDGAGLSVLQLDPDKSVSFSRFDMLKFHHRKNGSLDLDEFPFP
jgi:hypothetical protein